MWLAALIGKLRGPQPEGSYIIAGAWSESQTICPLPTLHSSTHTTNFERDRCYRLRLCLYYAEPGHIWVSCPVRPQNPRTARISELHTDSTSTSTSASEHTNASAKDRAQYEVLY
ncbi:hypothetical protein [Phaffia rhodozyma]|uniref:Uncharacterized protein n=1 Tax=Phaffia rhodozyma TaxID=264483 RepID=A0A0F7SUX3_PHARH|nr:hypothetical protein [Phaffia rhodozyma]